MLLAAPETANTLASDICPASSINKTSKAFSASSRAHSHAVPPATSTSRSWSHSSSSRCRSSP